MPNSERYLIDSDVLITSKNLYYRPDFCQAFWDWIVSGHKAGMLFSVDKVRIELLAGKKKDRLYAWAQMPELKSFFLPSAAGGPKWKELAKWATTQHYLAAAQAKFLRVESADAWLIAYAAAQGNYVIVTNEVSAPMSQTEIKLPDASTVLNVKTISMFDLLQKAAHKTFIFKP
ncbi:MAG: DUF4411 family protein [Candidatus Nitrotoga sp.]